MARRRRNLQRKWIWIGLGVAGATAATVFVVRRYRVPEVTGTDMPAIDGATAQQFSPQLDRLCNAPRSLTLDDRQILIGGVFAPAWNNYVAEHGQPVGPDGLKTALSRIALRLLFQTCGRARAASFKNAVGLADGGRMYALGQVEQG